MKSRRHRLEDGQAGDTRLDGCQPHGRAGGVTSVRGAQQSPEAVPTRESSEKDRPDAEGRTTGSGQGTDQPPTADKNRCQTKMGKS